MTNKVKVNLTPSEEQINSVGDMQTFVDQLILIGNEPGQLNVLGPDFSIWRWAIVSIEGGFEMPVPIPRNEENKMSLFNNGKSYDFSLEEAAIILAIYYFGHFDIIKFSEATGNPINPILNYPLSRAKSWESRMGGSPKCLESNQALRDYLMADEDLYSRSFSILD